jgi:hypothetical protein
MLFISLKYKPLRRSNKEAITFFFINIFTIDAKFRSVNKLMHFTIILRDSISDIFNSFQIIVLVIVFIYRLFYV